MKLNLCMGCMREKSGLGPCPHCGFQQEVYRPNPYYLPLETILAGKYLVGRVIGEGGFGITYVGYDLNRSMKIAIKEFYVSELAVRDVRRTNELIITSEEKRKIFQTEKRKFLDEAQRLARFRDLPGIVEVKDFFQENQTAYIVMEFVEGRTLQQVIDGCGGHMEPAQVLELMKPVMESLEGVHRTGLIHRDISPDNIMITPDKKGKLIDFGAARNFIQRAENMSVILKPHYAPLEQYKSKGVQGPWTDVYGLCATMYRAITGCVPDLATDRQEEDRLKRPSERGIKMPEYQEAALMKGLSLSARDRFQTMKELKEALTAPLRLTPGVGDKPQAGGGRERRHLSVRRKQVAKGIAAACGCLLFVLAVFFFIDLYDGRLPMGHSGGDQQENASSPATPEEAGSLTEESSPADGAKMRKNILRKDYVKFRDESKTVLGSDIPRENISSVHFVNSLTDVPSDGWDVSAAGDKKVMAWVENNGAGYDLYIAGEGGVCANEDSSGLFAYYTNMTEIDFGDCFDTSQVTDMTAMFSGCERLTKLDLTVFDTAQVTDMSFMFQSCEALTELNVSSFDTSQVTDMTHMFRVCIHLTDLDIRHFNTSQVTDMSYMFEECINLVRLDVSSFDTSKVTDMTRMFFACGALTELNISGFDKSKVEADEEMLVGTRWE